MADCEVCLNFGCDGEYEDFEQKTKVAEAELKCDECAGPIGIGQSYHYASGWFKGSKDSHTVCLPCIECMEAFCCNVVMYGGEFWGAMRDDAFYDMTTTCFDKLKTPAAKAKLQSQWIEWKFNQD